MASRSGGAFDPTFDPVFKLWGFGQDGPKHAPDEDALAAVMRNCGYTHLHAEGQDLLRKDIPDLQFNLNAIAPGYAVDRIVSILDAHGLSNTYVDVGGEVFTRGANKEGIPWQIGVERPDYDAAYGEAIEEIVPLSGQALATSGDYRNYFAGADGKIYSHLFDPRLGRPVTGSVGSVSVLAPNCMLADALATALYVLGPDEGMRFLTNYPGTEALFILRESDGSLREVRSQRFPAVP